MASKLAGCNATRLTDPIARKVVRSVQSTPEGLDIAEPGAVLELSYRYEEFADYEDDKHDNDEDDEV
jgi:hypothetical protein